MAHALEALFHKPDGHQIAMASHARSAPKIANIALHRDRRERFWLYARANLHATGGARHVQVSSSADLRRWSNWEVLRFDGVFTGKPENNIYYMQVSASGRQLLGFLPVRACASGP